MKYFKAEIHVMTELYVNNDKSQGCDPDTTNDCGIVETMKADTLDKLIKDLSFNYSNIEHFEDNRYETGYDNLERDGTHVCNIVSIYIYHCIDIELPVTPSEPINFNKGLNNE